MTFTKIKRFIVLLVSLLFFACKQESPAVHKISGKQINISDTIANNNDISDFVAPYKNHLNKALDSPLAYAPEAFSRSYNEELNIAIGNLIADITFEQVNPVFKARSGKDIDFVLMNYGGIRAPISAGTLTARTAYQVMPFENMVVVVELSYEKVQELLRFLIRGKRPHPLSSQIQIVLNSDDTLKEVSLHGKPLGENSTYFVATSDYLMNGGGNMLFFADPISVTETDYLLRNTIIDYFKKTDTIKPVVDNRFIKTE